MQRSLPFRLPLLTAAVCMLAVQVTAGESAKTDEKTLPANRWEKLPPAKVVIPEPWEKGRLKGVNSFGSEVYCDALGEILSLDGYTTAPKGKSTPNNYSDSLYAYHPVSGVFRLLKRSNWRAGARCKGPRGSYPLDENRAEPTPCPRHTYNGICFSVDSNKFYLINGANAGVPNSDHPKWNENNGTTTKSFWEFNIESKKWKQLTYPKVPRFEPYETVLRAIPGTHSLYLIGTWSVMKYDIKTGTWTNKMGTGRSPVKSGNYGCHATVDLKRKRIVLLNSAAKVRKGKPITEAHKIVSMRYYDIEKNAFVPISVKGKVTGARKAGLAYVDHMDAYAARTEKGLHLYFPESGEWKRPAIAPYPAAGKWSYMNYDRKRKLLILNRYAALRLDPKTLTFEEKTAQARPE